VPGWQVVGSAMTVLRVLVFFCDSRAVILFSIRLRDASNTSDRLTEGCVGMGRRMDGPKVSFVPKPLCGVVTDDVRETKQGASSS